MAPKIEMDPEKIPNYRAEADRYSKVLDAARQKAEAKTADRDNAVDEYKRLRDQLRDEDKQNASNHEAVDVIEAHVRSLEERDKAAGKESDELIRAREGLNDQREMAEMSQQSYERRIQELTRAETKMNDLKAEVAKYDKAVKDYEDVTEWYDLASRNANVAAIAIEGDPAATRRAVLEEVEHRADDYHEAQDRQRATFEELRRTEADVRTLKDEIKISQRIEKELEARVKQAWEADRGEEWASLQRELDRRHKQNLDLDERLAESTQKAAELTQRNVLEDLDVKHKRDDIEVIRKLADEDPAKVQERFTARMEGNADLAMVTTTDSNVVTLTQELEAEIPATTSDGSEAAATDAADRLDDFVEDPAADSLAADPGEGLDDVPGAAMAEAPAAASNGDAAAEAAPRVVDDEMLEQPPAADPATMASAPEPFEPITVAETVNEELAFDEPPVEPVAQEERSFEPEPEPEPEPELEPDPEPEPEVV